MQFIPEHQDWEFEPLIHARTISIAGDAFVLAKAVHVGGQSTSASYIDLSLPERISDYVYVLDGEEARQIYLHEVQREESVIPALACEHHGVYELYYSRADPLAGINVYAMALCTRRTRHRLLRILGTYAAMKDVLERQ